MKKLTGLLLLLLVVSFVHIGALTPGGSLAEDGYAVGDTARDFKLKNVDGKMVSLADYGAARGFIVIFTCNTCPYAKLYEKRIIALDAKYKAKGYPVIAIQPNDGVLSSGDSFEQMVANAQKKGFTFPYLLDETQEIARTYGATRTPHVYLLNKEQGKLKVAYIGAIDNNHKDEEAADKKYVEDAVDALLGGRKAPTTFTKAIGCGIKWKEAN